MAYYYRNQGPVRPVSSWEHEPDDDDDETSEEINEEITPEDTTRNET